MICLCCQFINLEGWIQIACYYTVLTLCNCLVKGSCQRWWSIQILWKKLRNLIFFGLPQIIYERKSFIPVLQFALIMALFFQLWPCKQWYISFWLWRHFPVDLFVHYSKCKMQQCLSFCLRTVVTMYACSVCCNTSLKWNWLYVRFFLKSLVRKRDCIWNSIYETSPASYLWFYTSFIKAFSE